MEMEIKENPFLDDALKAISNVSHSMIHSTHTFNHLTLKSLACCRQTFGYQEGRCACCPRIAPLFHWFLSV